MVVKVEAEPDQRERGLLGPGDGFNEDTSKLAIFKEEIVGPFQRRREMGEGADGVGGGKGGEEGEKGNLRGGGFQKKRDPKSEEVFRKPSVAGATMAGGLNFSGEDGRGGGKASAESVLRGRTGFKNSGPLVEGGGGREEEVDVGGLERIGEGSGFRGRNCRRS